MGLAVKKGLSEVTCTLLSFVTETIILEISLSHNCMKTGFNSILGDAYNRPYLDDFVFLTVDGMEMKVAGVFPVIVRK